MKYIRRRIINEIAGSPLKQKAIALAVVLKVATRSSSVVRNFSYYKIQKLTGLAYGTIRKYLKVLMDMGYAEIVDGNLFIKKISSRHRHKNIDISNYTIDKTRNVFVQIRDTLFLVIQARKDYVKSLLQLRKDPTAGTDFRSIRRLCRKYLNDPHGKYEEHGISYEFVARQVGCCARTAFSVVKDTIRRKWCRKRNRCEVRLLKGVNYREIPGFTFTTENWGFIIRSNTYTLSQSWADALNTTPTPLRPPHPQTSAIGMV